MTPLVNPPLRFSHKQTVLWIEIRRLSNPSSEPFSEISDLLRWICGGVGINVSSIYSHVLI